MSILAKDINVEYRKEMQSKRKRREHEQVVSDAAEIKRRLQLVKDGKDRFYNEEETEAMLRSLGYYEG